MLHMQRMWSWALHTLFTSHKNMKEVAGFCFTARWHCVTTRFSELLCHKLIWSFTKSWKRNWFIWRNVTKQFSKLSKNGYWEHRCHHIKYIAVFSKKILPTSLHKCQFQVQRKRGSFLPRIGHPQYKQWDTIIGTMNGNFFLYKLLHWHLSHCSCCTYLSHDYPLSHTSVRG